MSLKDSIRVMIVDDMATSRGLVVQALDEIGIVHFTTENDGPNALKKLVAQPAHLVISDFNMPGMDGLQLLEALRLNRTTQRIGFILITGRPDAAQLSRGQKLGLNNFLPKPFSTGNLRTCIERVTGLL